MTGLQRCSSAKGTPDTHGGGLLPSETVLLQLATVVRIALILYGEWQDTSVDVSYTDVDYLVYSDAAQSICDGGSPYARSTYRYTPLLAWLLVPNCVFPQYGKLLFSAYDIIAAMIMLCIVSHKGVVQSSDAGNTLRVLGVSVWLFSPFTATISTRGNGEALVVCMLMGLVYMLETGNTMMAALLYGVAVHWRIFPIIYAPSILIYIASSNQRGVSPSSKDVRCHFVKKYVSIRGIMFGLVSGCVFLGLGAVMHAMYGMEFLEETYVYHISRIDPRHNFSPYFYPAYLMAGKSGGGLLGDTGSLFGILGVLLQLFIAHTIAPRDISMACMIQSMAFVTFNKVSTAQYFVWYLCWISITLPHIMSNRHGLNTLRKASIMWPLALCHWLAWAYLLEFQGQPVHLFVWIAGLLFFFTNCWCIVGFSRSCLQ